MLFNVTTFLDSIIINCLNKKLEDFQRSKSLSVIEAVIMIKSISMLKKISP